MARASNTPENIPEPDGSLASKNDSDPLSSLARKSPTTKEEIDHISFAPVNHEGVFSRTLSSLRYREFRYLWLGMLFMMTAMQMQMVVRSYLTYEITSSPFLLGLVNAGFAIPMLALSLFGGAAADRMERKRIIQIGQVVAVALSLTIGVSIATDTVTWMHLLGVSMAEGALFAFLMPARQAMIPQLVGKQNLTNAMSLDAAAMSSTPLIAPAIGGGAVQRHRTRRGLLLNFSMRALSGRVYQPGRRSTQRHNQIKKSNVKRYRKRACVRQAKPVGVSPFNTRPSYYIVGYAI